MPVAFDHDDFIFELKMDGFRGKVYKSFRDLCASIHMNCRAVLGWRVRVFGTTTAGPQFYELMRRRCPTVFYAFECSGSMATTCERYR